MTVALSCENCLPSSTPWACFVCCSLPAAITFLPNCCSVCWRLDGPIAASARKEHCGERLSEKHPLKEESARRCSVVGMKGQRRDMWVHHRSQLNLNTMGRDFMPSAWSLRETCACSVAMWQSWWKKRIWQEKSGCKSRVCFIFFILVGSGLQKDHLSISLLQKLYTKVVTGQNMNS